MEKAARSEYRVAVVGLGKIGLPLAAQFAHNGLEVMGCDISQEVVDTINSGHSHVKEEPGLEEMVAEGVSAGRLTATIDTSAAVSRCNVVVVIVPLMVDEGRNIDYRAIDSATRSVAEGLQRETLVIYETTLPVGTTRTRLGSMLEQGSGLAAGRDFCLAFSPERVYSGRIFSDLHKYPKVVGGVTPECTASAERFYAVALEGAPVLPMRDADTAEFVKLVETTYRDVNIALANAFARFAAERDIPVLEAIAAANTQPFSHVHRPGIAVGGHCIPVYPYFLMNSTEDDGMSLVRRARELNDSMVAWALDRLEESLGGLSGKRVLVLGLAYRENVKETAFSGAVRLLSELKARGAVPLINDPLYSTEELARYAEPSQLDDLPAFDALVLQAYHEEYRNLDWIRMSEHGCKVVLDGRNALARAEIEGSGMRYTGIGQ
ncbi:MAG TPA: nucleotide sugar dehydrogenase [Chloroflexia bacterium]